MFIVHDLLVIDKFLLLANCDDTFFVWFQPLRYTLHKRLPRADVQQPFIGDHLRQEQKTSHFSRAKRAPGIQVVNAHDRT